MPDTISIHEIVKRLEAIEAQVFQDKSYKPQPPLKAVMKGEDGRYHAVIVFYWTTGPARFESKSGFGSGDYAMEFAESAITTYLTYHYRQHLPVEQFVENLGFNKTELR